MRNFLIVTFFSISFSVSALAVIAQVLPAQQQDRDGQRNNDNRRTPNALNRIKEVKTAYITKKLELTPDQSAKFWPLYNQYQEEMFAVQKQIRLNNSPLQTNGKDQILNEISLDEKKNNIKKRYALEFMKILPAEKVSLIYKSEKEFQDEVIRSMRERKNQADN